MVKCACAYLLRSCAVHPPLRQLTLMSNQPTPPISADVLQRAAHVRVVAFDVDGTLTDGQLWVGADGNEIKAFHAHDGLGMTRLMAHGVELAIITARISHAVAMRGEELGIAHVYQGQKDKAACLRELLDALDLTPQQAAFVGDDLTDLRAMQMVGLGVATANARAVVAERAHWQTPHSGGAGAARDVCDLILEARGELDAELERWL